MYLAVFATKITADPHAFDDKTEGGRLLYQLIRLELQFRGIVIHGYDSLASYQRSRSFLAAGILVDDVSNYIMLYGTDARKKDGRIHLGMKGFCQEENMVQVPMAVLAQWSAIHCPQNKIYIVENPSIFAMLCRKKEPGRRLS